MKIDFNRLDDLNARMTIVIEKPDYEPKLEESLKNYSKKLNIKGFRSGKTPRHVLTKMYGKGMLEESVTTLLNERLSKYLEDEKIDIFGTPVMAPDAEPVDFNLKDAKDYTFVFDLGLKPSFELNYHLDQPLDVMSIPVDQVALDDEILRYRRVFGDEDIIEDGVVEPFDRVTVKLNRILEDDSIEEEPKETVIDLERIRGDAASALLGMGLGTTINVDLEKFLGTARQAIVKNTLGLEADPDPDKLLNYKAEVVKIARPQNVELTGEKISQYLGQKVEDESGLRRILEERSRNTNQAGANDMKKMAARLALLKANPFEIPEEFLLKWVNSQREKKIEPGTREANNLFRDAKWSLLLNKIKEVALLEITEKDIQRQVTNWVIENVNYMQTDVRKLMKDLYANEYFMSTMKENALEEVVFAHLLPQYQFNEQEASKAEFDRAFHDLHHELFDHGEHSHSEYH